MGGSRSMCFNKGEGVLGRRFKYLILLGLTSYDVSKQDFFVVYGLLS